MGASSATLDFGKSSELTVSAFRRESDGADRHEREFRAFLFHFLIWSSSGLGKFLLALQILARPVSRPTCAKY
jgi:hypothetical protein